MKINIEICQSEAVKTKSDIYGRLDVDVDLTKLTDDQCSELALLLEGGYGKSGNYTYPISYPSGVFDLITFSKTLDDIRIKRLQKEVEKKIEEKKEQRRIEEIRVNFRGECENWLKNPTIKLPSNYYCSVPDDLRDQMKSAHIAFLSKSKKEDEAKADELKAKQKAIEARKTAQLADAVNRLGTDNQKARWAEGVLPNREAIELIEDEQFAELCKSGVVFKNNSYHYENIGVNPQEDTLEEEETEKRTLTAEQFDQVQAAIKCWPGCDVEYYKQTFKWEEAYETHKRSLSLARLSKQVEELFITCDIILPNN